MRLKSGFVYSTLLALLVTACSSDETISTSGSAQLSPESKAVHLQALSTKPWLITGGDVLVEVNLDSGMSVTGLRITLDDKEVTQEFVAVASGRLQALLTGLPLGKSNLKASLTGSGEFDSLALTNYPITGPIISGPHETPFYCQTNEFELVNGETLGSPNDSACSV
ncbi:MAG: DUF6351 family protein, partial [Pseudomonadota bacterium]|nr:DUF6351 family protein [Pseudomonadota bacterium]